MLTREISIKQALGFLGSRRVLHRIFWLVLALRFLVPLYDNPMDNLYSDPHRHWLNGERLFAPDFMGSVDPKLYQLFIWLVQCISQNKPAVVAVISGLLCAGTIWLWYRACREVFSPTPALVLGIIMGLCPSLTAIFTLIMNETLLLPLLGAGFWLTFRCLRKRTTTSAILAAVVWVLACYTRIIALPLALACLWYMLYHLPQCRWRVAVFTLALFGLCAVPASWHSYQKLNLYAPFGLPQMNQFYQLSHSKELQIHSNQGYYIFGSPSFYYPIGDPFFIYEYCRPFGPGIATINTAYGMEDWDREIARVKAEYTPDKFLCGLRENWSFLFFGNSWPDSAAQPGYKWLYYLNFQLRWMWLPLMLLLLGNIAFIRRPPPEMLLLCCALGLLLTLMLQQMVVMEGRYRKPLEPLLLIATYIIIRRSNQSREEIVTVPEFIYHYYLAPLIQWLPISRKSKETDGSDRL